MGQNVDTSDIGAISQDSADLLNSIFLRMQQKHLSLRQRPHDELGVIINRGVNKNDMFEQNFC